MKQMRKGLGNAIKRGHQIKCKNSEVLFQEVEKQVWFVWLLFLIDQSQLGLLVL